MKVHFIAIGGSVMHQLAIALHRKGYQVTGSDDEIFEPAKGNLEAEGLLPPAIGWYPEKIGADLDAVILGMHAKADNPELQKARDLGLAIYSFPEYIYQESRHKTRVVVGGSHGKTTTTSMIMTVLKEAGRPFDWLVGARLEGFSQSVNITDAPVIVCEGDEYPASTLEKRPKFHFLFPHIAILTGIAWDHINVFPTFTIYLEQFRLFLDKIEPGGVLIYNETDPELKKLVEAHPGGFRRIGYGVPPYRIEDGVTMVRLDELPKIRTEKVTSNISADHISLRSVEGPLKVFGDHNLLNLHAAFLACRELGIDVDTFLDGMAEFTGASKRLELLGGNDRVNIYRDFAHAPSKVKATIEAVKRQFPGRRLVALLELHTYSSLSEQFLKEYRGSMDPADEAAVFYSCHALELKRLPSLSKEKVAEGFGKLGLAVLNEREELSRWLMERIYKNVNLLLMSSGNYDGLDLSDLVKRITQ